MEHIRTYKDEGTLEHEKYIKYYQNIQTGVHWLVNGMLVKFRQMELEGQQFANNAYEHNMKSFLVWYYFLKI